MSLIACDTPRPFQPPVAQRDIKAEVIYCVGGVSSPLLMNVALHGMEQAAGVRYYRNGSAVNLFHPAYASRVCNTWMALASWPARQGQQRSLRRILQVFSQCHLA
jgi:hypothetical protein